MFGQRPYGLYVVGVLGFVLVGVNAAPQSLADLAKKEEQRRKEIKTPSKVYTNDDLRPVPAAAPPPATTPTAATTAPKETAQPAQLDASAEPPKDEAYWKKRMAEARAQLERDKIYVEALQSRVNALYNDFTARDDPAQRAVLAADRQRALGELDRLTKQIAAETKQISDIQEEARKAGVPAGWVR